MKTSSTTRRIQLDPIGLHRLAASMLLVLNHESLDELRRYTPLEMDTTTTDPTEDAREAADMRVALRAARHLVAILNSPPSRAKDMKAVRRCWRSGRPHMLGEALVKRQIRELGL